MSRRDIHKDGVNTQFPHNDPTKGGRPKKIYTILKELGYSKDDMRTAFQEMAWYTLSELNEMSKDDDKPVIVRIVANQFHLALKDGDMGKIKEILEQTLGKPKQEVANTGKQDIKINLNEIIK